MSKNTISTSKFYSTDYVSYSSYDNLRKIASVMDGQKNASRKVLYTVIEKNIKEKLKVSQLNSKMAEFAEYLHGSADNVIVNLGQDYPGSNNLPLLQKKGNFGTRFSQESSASRYIYTYGSSTLWSLFNKDDNEILNKQTFEGAVIEPMFYVPSLPILLINGSEGVSSGFAQKILSRNSEKIKKCIKSILDGKKINKKDLFPYFEGFNGTIEQGDNDSQWLIKGTMKRLTASKIEISEVPIGYDLKGYLKVLDDLEDSKFINSYKDKSEDDKFLFEVQFSISTLKEFSDDELMNKLKLIKKISENYTCTDENNKIKVFNDSEEILRHYINIKLEYLNKRKLYLIEKITNDIKLDFSKYLFIKNIVDGNLLINKRKKTDIEKDLDLIENILKKDNSYDYLLQMNIMSLTEERMSKLEADIKNKKIELDKLQKMSEKEIWVEEIK